jgi:hypothetical protein
LGATISPVSSFDDRQFDIEILIWKVTPTSNFEFIVLLEENPNPQTLLSQAGYS